MTTYLTIYGKPRYLGLANIRNADFLQENKTRWIVVKTPRGYEMGLPGGMLTDEQREKFSAEASNFEDTTEAMLQNVIFIREADDEDLENYYDCRVEEEDALLRARDILQDHGLKMKLVDVEYMLDRRKLYFYFTSEQRVDFRAFVRDLAHEFHTRIEMRQIGIRDEARIVRGIASCGRPCCCGYWLRGFSPISIRIVKEQRSALNPTKISGLCGRLMCCMSYEKEFYSELWSKLPGPGAKLKNERGYYVLESLDLGKEHVNVRFPNGRLVPVLISEFPDFKEAVLRGEEWGEDKELAEKKKAAQERMAMLKERAERAKNNNNNAPKVRGKISRVRTGKIKTERAEQKPEVQKQSAKPKQPRQNNRRKRQRKAQPKSNEQ